MGMDQVKRQKPLPSHFICPIPYSNMIIPTADSEVFWNLNAHKKYYHIYIRGPER